MSECINPALVPQRTLYTGEKIPAIGMGTFGSDRFTPEQVSAAVRGAIRAGYRLFDCAAVYGNEHLIGEVFKAAIESGEVKREELFITSKVWNNMHGEGDVLLSCAKSLKDLKLDYIDLFFVHWPFPNYHAPGCSVDSRSKDAVPYIHENYMKTWRQMERLVDAGLVRNIGTSNMTIPKLELLLRDCRIKPVANEMELHPCFQQEELYNFCIQNGIQPIGFCPIGSPTRPDRDTTPEDLCDIEQPVVVEIAKKHNIHPAVVCLKWAVQRGQIPIPFSIYEKEYISNLRCTIEDPLTPEEMEAMKTVEGNSRLIKGQVFLWESAKDWTDLWDLDGTITK
ncbi:aldo/keto reductase [Sporanaerobium hydrogeniformans]|uniref:Aldo/keto reductase n=1 Tax=Sporanaerobium hydrogeniformans TaxID=3072179 RepID=A0AC61DGQ8_9FIRM|nr:aldo/keto reductase [Sporanaerobium hydrogeniformans]PHV72138.1 aldo/keto reductase [Sporanaerobium hydrogeniformans]